MMTQQVSNPEEVEEVVVVESAGYKAAPWVVAVLVFLIVCCLGSFAASLVLRGIASNGSGATAAEETSEAPGRQPVAGAVEVEVTRVVTDNAAEAELAETQEELAETQEELAAAQELIPAAPAINFSDEEKLRYTAEVTGYSGWNVVGDEVFAYNFNAKGVTDEAGNQALIRFTLPAEERDTEGNLIGRWQVTINSPATGVMFYVSGPTAKSLEGSDATIRYLPAYANVTGDNWDMDGHALFIGESITAEVYKYVLNDMRNSSVYETPAPTADQITAFREAMGK